MITLLACHDLGKTYGSGELAELVLTEVNLELRAGEACVLLGPSGSGKTTLLTCIFHTLIITFSLLLVLLLLLGIRGGAGGRVGGGFTLRAVSSGA